MIQVKSFRISEYGDSSVGIPDVHWTLTGGFTFSDEQELQEVKKALADAFELICANRPEVLTDAEIQKENEAEAAMWKGIDQAEEEVEEMPKFDWNAHTVLEQTDFEVKPKSTSHCNCKHPMPLYGQNHVTCQNCHKPYSGQYNQNPIGI